MLIRRLTEDDLEALWMLRLRALTDNPESFGSTYEETIAQGNSWMLQRLRQEGEETFYLGAFEESLIGMIRFLRDDILYLGYLLRRFWQIMYEVSDAHNQNEVSRRRVGSDPARVLSSAGVANR
jgi:hypothetical protein